MKDQQAQPRSKAQEAEARKERLAQALRDNLAKRKGQSRARGQGRGQGKQTDLKTEK